jgi:hypothetical protein
MHLNGARAEHAGGSGQSRGDRDGAPHKSRLNPESLRITRRNEPAKKRRRPNATTPESARAKNPRTRKIPPPKIQPKSRKTTRRRAPIPQERRSKSSGGGREEEEPYRRRTVAAGAGAAAARGWWRRRGEETETKWGELKTCAALPAPDRGGRGLGEVVVVVVMMMQPPSLAIYPSSFSTRASASRPPFRLFGSVF